MIDQFQELLELSGGVAAGEDAEIAERFNRLAGVVSRLVAKHGLKRIVATSRYSGRDVFFRQIW